ncbi:hypothetical protein QCA50_015110 [Cerrena zonata]|uniref:F-box domain-containing protein n=1 Tax=Cerrena zonata TaxID=2478898 RepID=A0AAW0FKV0_9APHY
MCSLLDLPIELLLHILLIMPFDDILKCKRICKRINQIVSDDTQLQYQIKLGFNGMVDNANPNCTLPTIERLKRMSMYEDMWRAAPKKDYYEVQFDGQDVWEFSRNVLAQARRSRDLVFVQLPSIIRQTEQKRWEISDVGFQIRDFTMDPDQDLLVILEIQTNNYTVHLRSLTNGKIHSHASNPSLRWRDTDSMWADKIRIAGDYVALAFHPLRPTTPHDLVIWNWKTGNVHLAIYGWFLYVYSFLTVDLVIVLEVNEIQQPVALRVISLSSPSPDIKKIDDVAYVCRFILPKMQSEYIPGYMDIRSEPSPNPPSVYDPKMPFYTDTDKRMFLFTIAALDDFNCLMISGAHLMRHLRSPRTESNQHEVTWDKWGPEGCHHFTHMDDFDETWLCNVHGTRFVTPSLGLDDAGFHLFDCNQFSGRDISQSGGYRGDSDQWYLHSDAESGEHDHAYQEQLHTHMPVRQLSLFDEDTRNKHQAAMLSDDNIVLVGIDDTHATTVFRVIRR